MLTACGYESSDGVFLRESATRGSEGEGRCGGRCRVERVGDDDVGDSEEVEGTGPDAGGGASVEEVDEGTRPTLSTARGIQPDSILRRFA